MKVLLHFATLLLCGKASSDQFNINRYVEEEISNSHSYDQVVYYEQLCCSLKRQVPEEQRETISLLNVTRNWFLLLDIPKCRTHLVNYLGLIFNNEITLMEFLKMGEPVWKTLNDFQFALRFSLIVRGMIEKSILKVSETLMEFIFYSLNNYSFYILPLLLTQISQEERSLYLGELAKRFNEGIITEQTGFEDYLIFFKKATKAGLVTTKSYDKLIGSLFNVMKNSKPFKFNFIFESFRFPGVFNVPERYLQEYRQVLLISGLEGREKLLSQHVKVCETETDPNSVMNPISLEFRIPEFCLDYSILKIIAGKVQYRDKDDFGYQTEKPDELPLSDTELENEVARIVWPFYILAKMGNFEEADDYLDQVSSDILQDRLHIIISALRSFIPDLHIKRNPELEYLERQEYLDNFSLLLSFDGDLEKIEKWTRRHDMSKRLASWFQEKGSHQFIVTFGHSLINNRLTIVNLVEMGDSIWPFLRDLNLIKVLRSKLSHDYMRKREPRVSMASPNFQSLFMHNLVYFWYLLSESMLQADDQTRLHCLQSLAYNLKMGKFKSDSSLRVYLNFFFKVINMGLISQKSTIHFLKSLVKELEMGPSLNSNYIVMSLEGEPSPISQDLDNKFEWGTSGLEMRIGMNIKSILSNPDSYGLEFSTLAINSNIEPMDIDLEIPRIFHDEKFTESLLSFVLMDDFEEFDIVNSCLSNVAIKILIRNFLEMCLIESLQSGTCLEARGYLEATLSFLDDFELANRLGEILWSVVPLEFHPL